MKYACKVYWEQSCEVEIKTDKPLPASKVAEMAVEQAEEEIGRLTIKQDPRRKLQLSEIVMVPDSVNCDSDMDVQKVET